MYIKEMKKKYKNISKSYIEGLKCKPSTKEKKFKKKNNFYREEATDIQTSFLNFIIPRLIEYYKIEESIEEDLYGDLARNEYIEILNTIIEGFILKYEEINLEFAAMETIKEKEMIQKKYEEAKKLFLLYLDDMWC